MVHFVAATQPLAAAVSRADRLTGGRTSAVAISASGGSGSASGGSASGGSASGGSGSGGSVEVATGSVFGGVAAIVHEPGVAMVGLRALATVLNGLTAPEAVLRVEGTRLAIRTSSARFALPLIAAAPTPRPEVPVLGVATGLREAATVVAEATAKDGLPLFTAVRVRTSADRLTLVATDRFRAAVASVPWESHGAQVDALVPAASLAAAVRFVGAQVPVRADSGWFGVDWAGGGTVMPQLALPFPDAQIASLLAADPIATVDLDADALRGAVDRVMPFAPDGIVLAIGDGLVSVRGEGELGDAREDVKAATLGDLTTTRYQPRYLAEAVRAYAGGTVTIQVQQGIRPTVFDGGELRYLIVPLRG